MRAARAFLIAWIIALWPLGLHAQSSCETPDSPEAAAQPEVLIWVRDGLVLRQQAQQQNELAQQVATLRCEGCAQAGVRYSDSADMGQSISAPNWSESVRRLATVGALADDRMIAYQALADARGELEAPGDATAILGNQAILTALQFGDLETAARYLRAAGSDPDLAAPLLSDRLFWSVLVETVEQGKSWTQTHLDMLEQAAQLDPESFQVRFWRLVGWISLQQHASGGCASAVQAFVDLAFAAAQGSTCPLMMAHMGHGLELHFQLRAEGPLMSEQAVWLRGYAGLNAALLRNDAAALAASRDLEATTVARACSSRLSSVISSVLGTE